MSGQYKTVPNNPTRQDGAVHEYAPVEQVASEVTVWLQCSIRVSLMQSTVVAAAWLHHRVCANPPVPGWQRTGGSALASIVLLRARLFSLHIRREDREAYLDALECADRVHWTRLFSFSRARERDDMLWAVSELAREAVAPVQGGRTADVAAAVAGEYAR